MTRLALGGASYGYLYLRSLEDSLRALSQAGFTSIELTPVPPHLYTPGYGLFERRRLRQLFRALGTRCVSVNPSFTDLNLISTNTEIRDLTLRQLMANMELAHDLESPVLVVIPGRRNALIPTPDAEAVAVLEGQLERLLARAAPLGVRVALENSPYGFMQTSADLAALVERLDDAQLGIAFDCANAFMNEDPAAGVERIGRHLFIAHISDTWRHRWAHTSVGRGEVDFGRYADALRGLRFTGVTIYELVDGEDPDPRLAQDLDRLGRWGWTP